MSSVKSSVTISSVTTSSVTTSSQAGKGRTIVVRLNIDSEELLKLYRGSARNVSATSIDGQSIRFPAEALKPFVTHHGVQGQFALLIDAKNKLLDLRRH